MNLGEKIYQQRIKKELSQGDLAELLNVSRQSISKWENNTATPDLDKIVKMSELFEVSLDEFIKGEIPVKEIANEKIIEVSNVFAEKKQIGMGQRITGIILLCMAFLIVLFFAVMGGFLGGLIFASPFIACGVICLTCKQNAGLWCAWAIYLLLTVYLIWATGITWDAIFLSLKWTSSMNYLRLAIAWVLFIFLVILGIVTIKRFSNKPFTSIKEGIYKTGFIWIAYIVVKVAYKFIYEALFNKIVVNGSIVGEYRSITLLTTIFDCIKMPLVIVALVYAVRLVNTYLLNNKSK